MNYKAVVCDLDGTLFNSHHTLSPYTKEVIKKVADKGIKVFIATGRHYEDAKVVKEQLGINTYLITSNGTEVHNDKGEIIINHSIDKDLANKVIDLKVDPKIKRNLYTTDVWCLEEEIERLKGLVESSPFPYKLDSLENYRDDDILKFFYLCDDTEALLELEEELYAKFPKKFNIAHSLPTCLEVMARGVSKGVAIEEVFRLEGLKTEEALAFGDGLNDVEMLKTVGKGLIMGNCNYRLTEALPNHEVIKTNDEDGVAKYLEETFLK